MAKNRTNVQAKQEIGELQQGDKLVRIDGYSKDTIYEFDSFPTGTGELLKMKDGSYHTIKNLGRYKEQ